MSEKDKQLRKAAAMQYDEEKDVAPKVVAHGKGHVANRIIELAAENGIPLYEDRSLVEMLVKLDLGDTVPFELYQAVAEVLAFIYRLERRVRDGDL